MKLLFAVLGFALVSSAGVAKVDVTKKRETKIIRPSSQTYKTNKRIQNKRVETKVIPMKTRDSAVKSASDNVTIDSSSRSEATDKRHSKTEDEALKMEQLSMRLKSSAAFRKAYQDALKIEFENRAKVEKKKASEKKQATKDDINRYAKVRDGKTEELSAEPAGGE